MLSLAKAPRGTFTGKPEAVNPILQSVESRGGAVFSQ